MSTVKWQYRGPTSTSGKLRLRQLGSGYGYKDSILLVSVTNITLFRTRYFRFW